MDHVDYLLSIDAPTDTSYFLSQNKLAYTQSISPLIQMSWWALWLRLSKNTESTTSDPSKLSAPSIDSAKIKLIFVATAYPNTLTTAPSARP